MNKKTRKTKMVSFPCVFMTLPEGWYEIMELMDMCGYSYDYCMTSVYRMGLKSKSFVGTDSMGRKRGDRKKYYWPGVDSYVKGLQ